MSPSTLDELADRYELVSRSNQRMLSAFQLLARELGRAGIECVLLKGADVVSRLYGVWGTRPFCDVDLLIHDSDVARLDQLLQQSGFQQEIDGNPSYYSSQQGLRLDITTTIWYLDEPGLEALWQRTIRRRIGDDHIRCMHQNDLVLYLAAYEVLHRGACSQAFASDLRLLLEQEPIDWSVVLTEAARWNLRVPLSVGLTKAAHMEPLSIPSSVQGLLTPTSLGERLLRTTLDRLVANPSLLHIGHLLMWLTRPGVEKLTWPICSLWPSAQFLHYRYGDRGNACPLTTRLLRIGYLAKSMLLLLWKVAARFLCAPSHSGH